MAGQTRDVASLRDQAQALKTGTAVGYRAAELGHELRVQHEGKRFRIACSCGFRTAIKSTRKAAFGETLDHAAAVANGTIPAIKPAEASGVSPRIQGATG